jgi:hypothetical protein
LLREAAMSMSTKPSASPRKMAALDTWGWWLGYERAGVPVSALEQHTHTHVCAGLGPSPFEGPCCSSHGADGVGAALPGAWPTIQPPPAPRADRGSVGWHAEPRALMLHGAAAPFSSLRSPWCRGGGLEGHK